MRTNQQRADSAEQAIAAYSDDDTYTNLVDFLADAMHLCHMKTFSFRDVLDIARMHFEAEIDGDDILDDFKPNERNKP